MNSIIKFRNLPLAATVLMTAGALVEACTTTTAPSSTTSSTSGNTGTNTNTTTSTTGTGTTTATTTSSSSSTTPTDAATGPTLPTCIVPPTADGGFAPMINFSTVCTGDGGPNLACFGAYPTWYGGTFSYVNADNSTPNEAGVGCLTFGSQSTFAVTLDTTTESWNWAGEVGGYVGAGLYTIPCIDASSFTGIQFTMFGTVGATQDGGTGDEVQLQVSQLQNWNVASVGGTCLASDGGSGATCNPATASFPVPATAGTPIQIPWSSMLGGQPDPQFDPAHIIQIQWQLPWPCTGGTPYMTNLSIQNVGFYK